MTPEPLDGTLHVTPMTEADDDAVRAFLARVPRGEYLFLKDELEERGVIEGWRRRGGIVVIANHDDQVVGLLAVVPGLGWSQHVGDLRLVVDPAMRGQGIGAALARRGLGAAVEAGLAKVSVDILADQTAVEHLFRGLGFVAEALLVDQVRDEEGDAHDVLVLAHKVEETWSSVAAIGVIDAEAL
jgi:ribosomal protein S18 acetylase RimI-like enzyme